MESQKEAQRKTCCLLGILPLPRQCSALAFEAGPNCSPILPLTMLHACFSSWFWTCSLTQGQPALFHVLPLSLYGWIWPVLKVPGQMPSLPNLPDSPSPAIPQLYMCLPQQPPAHRNKSRGLSTAVTRALHQSGNVCVFLALPLKTALLKNTSFFLYIPPW